MTELCGNDKQKNKVINSAKANSRVAEVIGQ